MERSLAALFIALVAFASSGNARAAGLERCEELYVDANFDATRQCVRDVLDRLSERPDAIRDAYALLAAAEIAAERPPEARRALDVALAIDPAFEPDNPLLRSPRVQELFARVRSPVRGPDLAIVPLPVERRADGDLGVAVRAEGLRPPLRLSLRYRLGGSASWDEDVLSPRQTASGIVAETTIRPPPAGRSLETRFIVETPDDVTVLHADGPRVEASRPDDARATPPRSMGRPRHVPAPRRAPPRTSRGSTSATLWVVSAVSIVATTVAVIVAMNGDYPTLFTIRI